MKWIVLKWQWRRVGMEDGISFMEKEIRGARRDEADSLRYLQDRIAGMI